MDQGTLWCQVFDYRQESEQVAHLVQGAGTYSLVFLILPTPYVHKLGFCTLQAGLLGISLTPLHRTQFVPPNALLIMAFLAPYSSSRQ